MLTSHLFFIKSLSVFVYNKLGLIIIGLISLNKIKLNFIIMFTIFILIYYTPHLYRGLFLALVVVFLLKIHHFNFLGNFIIGFFKIHPPLFYISLVAYFYNKHSKQFSLKHHNLHLLLISILSLVLGGIWALYQLNWGYYWSTDPIELSLGFITLLYVYNMHTLKLKTHYHLWLFYVVVLYIQLIRSNLIYTKHNFFNNMSNFHVFYKIGVLLCIFHSLLDNYQSKHIYTYAFSRLVIVIICVLTLFLNFSYNIFVKLNINQITYYILFYIVLTVEWDDLKRWFLHFAIVSMLVLFTYFKLQYVYLFTLNTSDKMTNNYLFFKSFKKLRIFEKSIIQAYKFSRFLKNVNIITTLNHNGLYIKKKLLNYFI